MANLKVKKRPRGATQWPGLCTAARDLGVTYQHLARVLNGERNSKSLLIRYRAWVQDNPDIPARLPGKKS